MTKKSFLTVVFAVALVFVFVGCGSDKKNKEEAEKPDTGDTEAVTDTDPTDTSDPEAVTDTDPADADDNETAPDEDNTGAETGDEEMQPDIDWNELPDDCTTSESYGKNFLTRDNVPEICYEKIAGAECYGKATADNVETLVEKLQEYEFVFNRETCRDLNEKDESGHYKLIPCPDFIPEKFKLSQLAGCEIYTVLPEFDCIAPCPDIYFLTDNDYFKTVSYKSHYKNSADKDKMNLNSLSSDGKISFSSSYYAYDDSRRTTFSWSETAEDSTEIEKKVSVEMVVADSSEVDEEPVPDEDIILAQCEDSEGRIYKEGDLISEKCGALICSENGWDMYSNTECNVECDPNAGVVGIRYWTCPDWSDLEWCFCDEDENHNTKLNCVERIDLQCPQE